MLKTSRNWTASWWMHLSSSIFWAGTTKSFVDFWDDRTMVSQDCCLTTQSEEDTTTMVYTKQTLNFCSGKWEQEKVCEVSGTVYVDGCIILSRTSPQHRLYNRVEVSRINGSSLDIHIVKITSTFVWSSPKLYAQYVRSWTVSWLTITNLYLWDIHPKNKNSSACSWQDASVWSLTSCA